MLTEQYRQTYYWVSPHNSLGYQPPAPEVMLPAGLDPVLVTLT